MIIQRDVVDKIDEVPDYNAVVRIECLTNGEHEPVCAGRISNAEAWPFGGEIDGRNATPTSRRVDRRGLQWTPAFSPAGFVL